MEKRALHKKSTIPTTNKRSISGCKNIQIPIVFSDKLPCKNARLCYSD